MGTRVTKRVNRAFTLIEILIVVVILGILAAIVIPQFTDASEDASLSSVRSQLQTIRSQIELFRVQNAGALPDFAGTAWDDLVNNDYLQQEPTNPFNNSDTVLTGAAAPAAGTGDGWWWDGSDMWATDPTDVDGDTVYYFDDF
jgi:general secretion pathway protein G